jgi:hypothetical protein
MKNIIVSIVILGIIVVGLIVVMPETSESTQQRPSGVNNAGFLVKFHVTGCDNCTGLQYCIDGGDLYTVNSCAFAVDLSTGQHTICVMCNYNKRGKLIFTVRGDPFVQDEYVSVQDDNGAICNCAGTK